eukprot:350396-Chlamydomonas_euryale.AAC.2
MTISASVCGRPLQAPSPATSQNNAATWKGWCRDREIRDSSDHAYIQPVWGKGPSGHRKWTLIHITLFPGTGTCP